MNANGMRLALLGAVAAAALAGLRALGSPDPLQRNVEVFTEMAYSRAAEAFTPNAAFANGMTLQPLVPGVVVHGRLPFPYGPGPEEARRAGEELTSPFEPGDEAAAKAGAALFAIYCVTCHDARGNGQGPSVRRGMFPPPSLHAARATSIRDGEIFHVLTLGQGNMASYAAQLSATERWQVIAHVRNLQKEGP